jgi:hypothetical protein
MLAKTVDLNAIKRDLSTAMRRCKTADARAAEAAAERDRAIRDAIEAKIPRSDIIALTGLSSARVEQIKRRARK